MITHTVKVSEDKTEWYLYGQRHREDGPAIEFSGGYKEWYLYGKQLTEQEFLNRTNTTELTLEQIATKFNIPIDQLKIKK
jgi:hypothetical protein